MIQERIYSGVIAGAKAVMSNKAYLNQINVFPVADGDTGSNLYAMMNSIIIHSEVKSTLKSTFQSIADAAIIGARGNSGIIFAQYFLGISDSIHKEDLKTEDFAMASGYGMRYAYEAVEHPVEGTILTIMKIFHNAIKEHKFEDLEHALEKAYLQVRIAVDKTTEQLKVLKQAAVVDSGAKGFLVFLSGFIKGIKGENIENVEVEDVPEIHFEDHDNFRYRYCTEALLKDVRGDLESTLYGLGDSLVVAGSPRLSRVHIHTDDPVKVFESLEPMATLVEQKVDDMLKQKHLKAHRKHDTVIVTDSIADLPKKYVDDEQIHMIHLPLLINNSSYFDRLTIRNEQVLKHQATSSTPSELSVMHMYDYLSTYYENIIVITVAKKLSGTYQLLKRLAPEKATVIDSSQNAIAEGLIVYQAAKYLNEKRDLIKEINKDIEQSKILVKIDNLDAMIASGRLSTKAGSIAKRIGLKPIVTLKDGEGALEHITLSRKQAKKKIVKHLYRLHKKHPLKVVGIGYVDDPKEAYAIKADLESKGISVAYVTETSGIIAAGAGSGAIGVGYIKE